MTYNPKLTGENTLGQQITNSAALTIGNEGAGENGEREEDDTVAKDAAENEGKELAEGGEVIKFQTSKIE